MRRLTAIAPVSTGSLAQKRGKVMAAMARPACVQRVEETVDAPDPMSPELAIIALTLADHEASIWLDAPLASSELVRTWLSFHTGAAIVIDPASAQLALISAPSALIPFESFALGSEDYPDRSTTLVLAVRSVMEGVGHAFEGPGMRGVNRLAISPEPPGFAAGLRANRARFPRGVDLIIAAPGRIAALPRSSRLIEEA